MLQYIICASNHIKTTAMARTTAADMVGLTIYAKGRVPLLRYPQDSSPVHRFIEPGQRIGIVRGWSDKRPASKFWYFEVEANVPGLNPLYSSYVPYDPALLNLPRLGEEFQDYREDERRRNLEWWQRAQEDVSHAVAAGGSQLVTGALVLGGIYVLGKIFTK